MPPSLNCVPKLYSFADRKSKNGEEGHVRADLIDRGRLDASLPVWDGVEGRPYAPLQVKKGKSTSRGQQAEDGDPISEEFLRRFGRASVPDPMK